MCDHTYFVYILSSRSRALYVGVTNDLARRIYEHKAKLVAGFASKYHIDRLVHFEATESVEGAIFREKQIKAWARWKKVRLIEASNPTWEDLEEDLARGAIAIQQVPRAMRPSG